MTTAAIDRRRPAQRARCVSASLTEAAYGSPSTLSLASGAPVDAFTTPMTCTPAFALDSTVTSLRKRPGSFHPRTPRRSPMENANSTVTPKRRDRTSPRLVLRRKRLLMR